MKCKQQLLTTIFVAVLCLCSFGVARFRVSGSGYRASALDDDVQYAMEEIISNDETTYINSYASVYFSNLRENLPLNSHGTCSLTAMSMLLSFFDSYWDDSFVDEVYEVHSVFSAPDVEEQRSLAPSFGCDSPGVVSEDLSIVADLSASQYASFAHATQSTYLQSHLFAMADSPGSFSQNVASGQAFSMGFDEQETLLSQYLIFDRSITSNIAILNCRNSVFFPAIREFVIDEIISGLPVLINVQSSVVGPHTVIAYDYSSDLDEVYVHPGWKTFGQPSFTHVPLSSLGVSSLGIDSAIAIEPNAPYDGFPKCHYSSGDRSASAHDMIFPSNVRVLPGAFDNLPGEIVWDSLYDERWYSGYDIRTRVTVRDGDFSIIHTATIEGRINRYLFPLNVWHALYDEGPYNCFFVELEAVSYSCQMQANGCLKTIFKNSSSDSIDHIIEPSDCDVFGQAFLNDEECAFENCFCGDGFVFGIRGRRVASIGGHLVLSPKRRGFREAYVEYQFSVPVDRMDIELSHWGDNSSANLNQSNASLRIETLRYNEYREECSWRDMLSDSFMLSVDRNDMSRVPVYFPRPATRVRVYAETLNSNTNNSDDGRICIGNVAVYENPAYARHVHGEYLLSGYEWEYGADDRWENRDHSYNCYNYALNTMFTVGYEPLQPGRISNWCGFENDYSEVHGTNWYYDLNKIRNYLFCDLAVASDLGLIDFFDFTDDGGILADRFEACAEGFYKVMLALDTSSTLKDYHWYRQNSDGTWSHKPASGAVRNYDYDGNPIIDPEYCNKKSCEDSGFEWLGYDYEFNYSDGCAFFSVPLFSY